MTTLVLITAVTVDDGEDVAALATKAGDAIAAAVGAVSASGGGREGAQAYETTERGPENAVRRAASAVAH